MGIIRHEVRRCLRPGPMISMASLALDFELSASGHTASEEALARPNVSLYAFDLENNRAIFTETPNPFDLVDNKYAFLYQRQRSCAQAVYLVDFEQFHKMSREISLEQRSVICIFSTGRCGSTLLDQVLSRSSQVVSLSEPDVYSQLVGARLSSPVRQEILRSSTKFLWRTFSHLTDKPRVAIKFRSEVCSIWSDVDSALGCVPSIFMYRRAAKVLESWDRVFRNNQHGRRQWLLRIPLVSRVSRIGLRILLHRDQKHIDARAAKYLVDISGTDVVIRCGWCGHCLLEWLDKVDAYLSARARFPYSIAALRYEDLIGNDVATVKALFGYLGIPVEEAAKCCLAMKHDAHEKSGLARGQAEYPFDERTLAAIDDIVTNFTRLGPQPDLLPGTLSPLH